MHFVETYKGYDIYFYEPGEYPGYQDDGYSASGISRLFAYLPDLKAHIDVLTEPEPEPECPIWMQRLWKIAVERNRERVKKWLQRLAKRKGCTLIT